MNKSVLVIDEAGSLPSNLTMALHQKFDVTVVRGVDDVATKHVLVALVAGNARTFSAAFSAITSRGITNCVAMLGPEPSLDEAITAIRAGCADYITVSDDIDTVIARVSETVSMAELRNDLERLHTEPVNSDEFPEIIGESETMLRLRERLKRVSNSDVAVLITGGSGTGKDVVAHALHRYGRRTKGPLVVVNCGAVPQQLMESEIFGCVGGAHAGVDIVRTGFLVEATGGTIYLNEIAALPSELQAKLLRAIQERKVTPLGQVDEITFDARVIASSSMDLEREVALGRFREDLLFRLNVVRIQLPALHERGHDILLLAQHFIRLARTQLRPVVGFTPAVARSLMAHDWPGNVRELEDCIIAAVTSAHFDHITTKDLPEYLRGCKTSTRDDSIELMPLSERERLHILEILVAVGGNKSLAARHLGLDRKTLARKLRGYEQRSNSTAGVTGNPESADLPLPDDS